MVYISELIDGGYLSNMAGNFVINPHKQQVKRERKSVTKPYFCSSDKDILLPEEVGSAVKNISVGTEVSHKMYGRGKVSSLDGDTAVILFNSGREAKLSLTYVLKKGIITTY